MLQVTISGENRNTALTGWSYSRNLLAILESDLEEKSRGLLELSHKGGAAAIIDSIEENLDVS